MSMLKPIFTVSALLVLLLLVAQPAAAMSGAYQGGTVFYTVKANDTLSGIAIRYHTSVPAIVRTNGLAGSTIYPDQTLRITSGSTSSSSGSASPPGYSSGYHMVKAGESLSGIAARYGISVAALMQANRLSSTTIYPGQRLSIPAGRSAAPLPTSSPSTHGTPFRSNTCGSSYIVQKGDTLYGIARKCGVSSTALKSFNHLTTTALWVGQKLRMPSTSPLPSATVAPATLATRTIRPTVTPSPVPPYEKWKYPSTHD